MSKSLKSSGLKPLGRAVLIRHHKVEALRGRGIIHIPEMVSQNMQMLEQEATVVAVGPAAWQDERVRFLGIPLWRRLRAKPGDHVIVTKFAGFLKQGADGEMYRFVNDRDIFAGVEGQLADLPEVDAPLVEDEPGAQVRVA